MTNVKESHETDTEDLLLQHELEILGELMGSKRKYRKVVQAAIARWVKDFQEGKIHVTTVDDLRKLIEMDIRLQQDEL